VIDTTNHDQLTHIPGGEGKDKTGKEPMGSIFGFAGKDDQTENEVHGKGKGRRKGQNIHPLTLIQNLRNGGIWE
jgi:hypothetical protein